MARLSPKALGDLYPLAAGAASIAPMRIPCLLLLVVATPALAIQTCELDGQPS